jgi:RNA polymerase sigma-70 factor (ECF subfamily)
MDPELPVAELARRIASTLDPAGAAEAEAAFCRRFAPRIELYGLRHLGSRAGAQDLVQDVLMRTLEAIRAGRLENPALLASFVLGTCRNVSWDRRRGEQRQRKLEDQADIEATAEPPALTQSDVMRLYTCLGQLQGREAQVIRMSFLEDREPEEISTRLDLSLGNIRVIRHRALAKLSICLNPEGA